VSIFEPGPASRFIGASSRAVAGGYGLFGAPYDGTASFRAGARFGPDAIRAASDGLETYSPWLDADLEEVDYADLGDVPTGFGGPQPALEAVEHAVGDLLEAGVTPVMLGGEHSLTAAAFRAVRRRFEDGVMLQVDAHADLRESYLGEQNSHACAMRRCVETGAELIQFGVRSGTREEWQWMRAHDTLVGRQQLIQRLRSLSVPIYLTVDIDVFDPSVVPGTGTPEPGGIGWGEFQDLVAALRDSPGRVVAFDVMELAPTLDPSGMSAVLAAKVVRELLLAT
jgi:agmatinase